MCTFGNTIKFCRCETKTTPIKPTWTLKRYASVDWMTMEQGRCHLPSYDSNEKDMAESITTALNSARADCFDMDYQAVEGDTLNITLPDHKTIYEFEFKDGQWQQQNSISTHLNKDLIIASGWIEDL